MSIHELFHLCINKQTQLRENPYWRMQIPKYCPPVLWFGDHNSKELFVCLALNPSIREFFESYDKAWMGEYLPPSRRRFYHLTEEDLQNIHDEKVYQNVSKSYDEYFTWNPFTKWFGKKQGYNIEGFLNGMNASFYNALTYRAVLIDLIPFVTIDDFSDLSQKHLEKDLFINKWATTYVNNILSYLNPKCVIIFGRKTVNYYNKYIGTPIQLTQKYIPSSGRTASYNITDRRVGNKELPFIGLSTNLGNPIGFSIKDLNNYGQKLMQHLPILK